MAEAEFHFVATGDVALDDLKPLYARILGKGEDPHVTITSEIPGFNREAAEAWLRDQHKRYVASVGKRSMLLQKMDIVKRVTLDGFDG